MRMSAAAESATSMNFRPVAAAQAAKAPSTSDWYCAPIAPLNGEATVPAPTPKLQVITPPLHRAVVTLGDSIPAEAGDSAVSPAWKEAACAAAAAPIWP